MKIFISGVAGFLGSYLAEKCINENHEVIGCDNLLGGYIDNIPKKVIFYKADCNNLNLMKKILKNVDVTVHTAASAYEGLSVFSPTIVNKNNYLTTCSLLSASIHNKVKKFVFTSSMARYGNQKIPFKETYKTKPEDPYGISKVASEMLIKNLCNIHNMDWTIAVPHNIIGPRQKYDDPYRNVASIFINRILQNKQPIIYGDGEQKRCFSFIQDCVEPLFKIIIEDLNKQIINIGPDEEFITINKLAKLIGKIINFDLKPIYINPRPCEIKYATCSSNKARKILNYKTTYNLKKGLNEMVNYIQKRGTKPFKYHLPLEFITNKTPKTWSEKLM